MSSWTIVSKTCWRVKYIVCEQFYLTSMTIIWIEISILWNSMVWLPCYLVWMDFFLPLIYWECELFCLILYIFCTLKYCFHPCAKFWWNQLVCDFKVLCKTCRLFDYDYDDDIIKWEKQLETKSLLCFNKDNFNKHILDKCNYWIFYNICIINNNDFRNNNFIMI